MDIKGKLLKKGWALIVLIVGASTHAWATETQACNVQRALPITQVVELYTSEGCSSCPPADRWLSSLRSDSGVLAMSFHVNYWNSLGWKDPYASVDTTQRQYQWQKRLRGPYAYTPQVIVNGQDWRAWPSTRALPVLAQANNAPRLQLRRTPEGMVLDLIPAQNATAGYAGYWVYLQDDITSRVRAGENNGKALRHDHVVRWYQPVTFSSDTQAYSLKAPAPGPGSSRVAFVLTQADSLTPVAAVVMPLCS